MAEKKGLPKREVDFAAWYREVVMKAKLAERAPVKGCMTMLPNGYAIWENIHDQLNPLIKEHGAQNVCFPIFIPESYLAREKEHVEGFSPEIAVVTYAGGEELEEKLVVRPTSETIIHESMGNWIQSYNDLPLRINQWCNVVRWEKHPRLFLRTSEFQWQEGHTAHATENEARKEVDEALRLYHDFCEDVLAIPTVMGRKSEKEKFAGAVESYSIEGLMPDGRSLQMGTAHYLGDNFSRMAGVDFTDSDGSVRFAQMTSWGVSTRLIGALIMVHGDDKGLVLPPLVAPVQVMIVPVKAEMGEYAQKIAGVLKAAGLRVEVDDRSNLRVGAKYYDSELRGIPLRIEVGQSELDAGVVTLAVRHSGEKMQIPFDDGFADGIKERLETVQKAMLESARAALKGHIREVKNKDDFAREIIDMRGFVAAPWCGDTDCELSVKEATGAVTRNLPLGRQTEAVGQQCIWCGKPAQHLAYFAKAY